MQARRLPAARGWGWIVEGFRLYRRNPPLLTSLTLAYLLLVVVTNLIPQVGPFVSPLLLPLLTVMVANGCRALDQGGFRPDMLTAGLSAHRLALVKLGGLQLLAALAVLAVFALWQGGDVAATEVNTLDEEAALYAMAHLLVLALPVALAFWFAPLLVAWDGVPALKSLFFSIVAARRNWRAFLVYALGVVVVGVILPGVVMLVVGLISKSLLAVLAIVLRMLMLFILAPILMISVYLSYRDVFGQAPENE